MLVLKDDLSIELFDVDRLEASIMATIELALDAAIGYGAGDCYRSSGSERITADVAYYVLKMDLVRVAEIREQIVKHLNVDERRIYAESHGIDATSDGVLPAVSPSKPTADSEPTGSK